MQLVERFEIQLNCRKYSLVCTVRQLLQYEQTHVYLDMNICMLLEYKYNV